jgi:hypothetical protein
VKSRCARARARLAERLYALDPRADGDVNPAEAGNAETTPRVQANDSAPTTPEGQQ